MVLDELFPITQRNNAVDLAQSFSEIVGCHMWVHDKLGYLHRDVSLKNMMICKEGGVVYGVMNDWDLAIKLAEHHAPTSLQRTGTRPFTAQDLLDPPPPEHLYRHDLESFFYVLIWTVCRHLDGGVEIENPPFAEWDEYIGAALMGAKALLFRRPIPWPTDTYAPLTRSVNAIWRAFVDGFYARAKAFDARTRQLRHTFNDATLGDHVTGAGFIDALTGLGIDIC